MVQLQRLSILAKPSPAEDFRLLINLGSSAPPDSVVAAASDWLQAHMSADNGQSVIVAGPPEDRWLFRAADEEGTDNSGRKRAYIAFGALPPDLDPVTLTRLLFGAFRTRKPSKEDGNTCTIELAPESAANNQLVVSALVSLATGATRIAVLDNDATAARVIEGLGTARITFIALMRRYLPTRWPEGTGLVVSAADWEPPAIVRGCRIGMSSAEAVDFGGLYDLSLDTGVKLSLLGLAVDGFAEQELELSTGDSGAVDWLLRSRGGRQTALRIGTAAQVGAWLRKGDLGEADLEHVADRIRSEDSTLVARVLQGHDDAVERFVRFFGPGAPGVEDVLSSDATALLARLRDPTARWDGELADESVVAQLLTAGLLRTLDTPSKARLLSTPMRRFIEPLWREEMRREFMPDSVFTSLFDGYSGPDLPPVTPPRPLPREAWVVAVPKEHLWRAGEWACSSRDWMQWWCDALRCHPDFDERDIPSLESGWSPVVGAWLCGGIRDGQVLTHQALLKLAAWRRESPGPSLDWQLRILKAAGLDCDRGIGLLISGATPPDMPTHGEQAVLRQLLLGGVLVDGDVVRAVAQGADASWLEAAGFDAAVVSLLDPRRIPPVEPPVDWPLALDPLLARACGESEFWQRFGGHLSASMLEWILERTQRYEGGQQVAVLLEAYSRARPLPVDLLRFAAGALPFVVVCRQVAAWATHRGAGEQEALGILLGTTVLSPELQRWLTAELLTVNPTPTLPYLTVQELTALLPLLHPIRDVLRPILARSTEEPGEEALAESLAELLSVQNGPIPPAPPRSVAQLHPRLVERIARVPGWESWAISEEAMEPIHDNQLEGCDG
jgi:hypothetical protein